MIAKAGNISMKRIILTCLTLLLLVGPIANAHAQTDEQKIIHLMKAMFDSPDNPLSVEPVVVNGDYAIAGWVQGERGGRALLKRKDADWKIHLCAGDALKEAHMLEHAGIDNATAVELTTLLAKAESGTDKAILAKFTSFEGVMMVDENAGASAHAHHGQANQTGQSQ